MAHIIPDDMINPQVANLINAFNDDALAAFRDGISVVEAVAVAGSITETLLRSIDPIMRDECWQCIIRIMNRKLKELDQ